MSSRRRLYLNLKSSITKLFKTPAHYLKEITGKQSLFEKPYFDKDYRAMHLKLPVPSWKRPEFDPGGIWPEAGSRKLFVIFDEGICSVSSFGGDCGEAITISGWLALLPPAAYGTPVNWSAEVISGEDLATIGKIETSLWGHSATINVQLSDVNSGTVVICVRTNSGPMLKELRYDCPPLAIGGITKKLVEWTPSFGYARNNLVPYYQSYQTPEWDCGCVELEVDCCNDTEMSWDESGSASTIGQDTSVGIKINDPNPGGPYSWSVSGGQGFSLSHSNTVGLSNQLNADATACGTATITVTGCAGNTAFGDVRGTEGSEWVWISDDDVDPCYNTLNCLPDDKTCPQTASGEFTCDEIDGGTKKTYTFHWLA